MKPWSKAEEQRLRELYPTCHTRDLVATFERPVLSIKSRAGLLGIRKAPGFGAHLEWTFANDYMLRMYYPHIKTAVIAARIRATGCATYNRAKKLGLAKTPIYMASPDACRLRREVNPGTRYRFPKGHVPANKGTRRPGFAPGRMRETQFKKGNVNYNRMPLGSTRLVDGYVCVKVAEVPYVAYTVNWKPLHLIEWERVNGELPDGHALAFKDGNRLNTSLRQHRADLPRRTYAAQHHPQISARVERGLPAQGRDQPHDHMENTKWRRTKSAICVTTCSRRSKP